MLTHKGTQTIKTERLILRRFAIDDAQMMYDNWAKDKRVTKYMTWEPHASVEFTAEKLSEWVSSYQNENYYHWGIEFNSKLIGSIGVMEVSDRNSNGCIGYCIGYDYWGNGIMTEALSAVLKYMFEEVNMHRLAAYHDVENIGSGKVMEKAGMIFEGVDRESMIRIDGSYADMRCYGILKREWEEKKRTQK